MSRPMRDKLSDKSLILIGIPKYLCDKELDDFETNGSSNLKNVKDYVGEYINNLEVNLKNGDGIFFCGSNGVGKTMLSCIILKEAYRRRYMCRRISFARYIDLYTNSWGYENNVEEVDEYEWYKSCDILVLEELGKEIDSKIAKPVLEDLLRYRQENNKVTLVCSNLTPEDFKQIYGNSIASLVNGSMTVVKIVSGDMRKRGNK